MVNRTRVRAPLVVRDQGQQLQRTLTLSETYDYNLIEYHDNVNVSSRETWIAVVSFVEYKSTLPT